MNRESHERNELQQTDPWHLWSAATILGGDSVLFDVPVRTRLLPMFEAFYRSFLQHPVLLWVIPVGFLFVRWRGFFSKDSASFLGPYLGLVLIGTLLDAALTSDRILGALGIGPVLSQVLAIGFVVLGDFRVLYLVLRLHGNRPSLWLRALGLSFIVPLLQGFLTQIAPSWFSDVRHTFLAYELLFILLLSILRSRLQGAETDRKRRLAKDVVHYALAYYCLWVVADGIILLGADLGYLMRVLPNLLYYGAFAPFVDARAASLGLRKPAQKARVSVALLFAGVAIVAGCGRPNEAPTPCPSESEAESAAADPGTESPALKVAFFRETTGAGRETTVSELKKELGVGERVESQDPYYKKKKLYWGWAVEKVLAFGFGKEDGGAELVFQATDGYQVRLPKKQIKDDNAYLVYADAELGELPPIGPRSSDPRPLYLIWSGDLHTDLSSHPRPFSVNKISIASDQRVAFGPKTGFPPGGPERRGQDLFVERCVRCHALNQVGGRVGPDLNVPRNILAYRSEADARAYIRDPRSFRYGAMPSHLDLSESDLDALMVFLRAMGRFQSDPGPKGGDE